MMPKPEPYLELCLPEGQLVNRAWLRECGFNRPNVDYFLRAGKLEAVAHGVYRRPGPPLKWEHIVYSLNEMGCTVHVGGRSALELQGMAHYLPAGGMKRIDLYSKIKPAKWVENFEEPFRFETHTLSLFDRLPDDAIRHRPFGAWDWPIPVSTPELAMLELLAGVRESADFSVADSFFEAAGNFRPNLLHVLLQECSQVKAKRLFLWFANRHGHAWLQAIKTDGVDLGRGKRMLVRDGAYDPVYQITVPREMAGGNEQPLY